jgi:hypothetical protein
LWLIQVLITDFFGGVQSVELTDHSLKLDSSIDHSSDVAPKPLAHETPSQPVLQQVKNKVAEKKISDLVPLNFLVGLFIYAILIIVSLVG